MLSRPFAIKISINSSLLLALTVIFLLKDMQDPIINLVLQPTLDSFLNTNYKLSANPSQMKAQFPIMDKELRFLYVLCCLQFSS